MNNIYGTAAVPTNIPTVVVGLSVPERGGYSFKGIIIWSEVDCIIDVRINGVTVSGGRISGAVQTLTLDFSASPYGLGEHDLVTVLATQSGNTTYSVYATLLVEQL